MTSPQRKKKLDFKKKFGTNGIKAIKSLVSKQVKGLIKKKWRNLGKMTKDKKIVYGVKKFGIKEGVEIQNDQTIFKMGKEIKETKIKKFERRQTKPDNKLPINKKKLERKRSKCLTRYHDAFEESR